MHALIVYKRGLLLIGVFLQFIVKTQLAKLKVRTEYEIKNTDVQSDLVMIIYDNIVTMVIATVT